MANIPVERTSSGGGMPWWAWLLGVLVLLGVIWLLVSVLTSDDSNDRTTATDDTTMVAPAQPADEAEGGVLTDPRVLAQAPDGRVYDGREVRLTDLRVEVAYSDSVFYAVPAEAPVDRRFFVVVGDPATPGIGGPANLDVGSRVDVHGYIREPSRNDLQGWDITEDERDRLMRLEDYYIRAQRVDR